MYKVQQQESHTLIPKPAIQCCILHPIKSPAQHHLVRPLSPPPLVDNPVENRLLLLLLVAAYQADGTRAALRGLGRVSSVRGRVVAAISSVTVLDVDGAALEPLRLVV